MESTTKGNDLRFVEPQTVVHYTRDGILSARIAANQDNNNDNNDSSNLSTGVSAYSPRQIGANLSSIASSSHYSSNDRNLSNVEPRAAVSSESVAEIQKMHSAVHHLDLARTPHPCIRMRAMAGSDLENQPINKRKIKSLDVNHVPFASTSSSPLYFRSTVSSRAHSSKKKSSSHHSKTPSASRARSSGVKSSSHQFKSPVSSYAPSSDKKSSSHYSKPVLPLSRLPYHERPSRRERSSRQSIELARRIQRGKEEAKAQKEKEAAIFVFNVRKHVLVDLLQSLYDQPDDTIIAIRVKKEQLRTLSEYEASKERRRQRRQGE